MIAEAKAQLVIRGTTKKQIMASRSHRDGFLFECISWIVARQAAGPRTFLKDPHIDATSHGLDGLIVELHPTEPVIVNATICEDKCTVSPRRLFFRDVMKTFRAHHRNKRARDLVAHAAALIREIGLDGTQATQAAARVLEKAHRSYRAALTTSAFNGANGRAALFAGYAKLDGITQAQRIGATFVVQGELRDWFQALSDAVDVTLDGFAVELAAANKGAPNHV